MNVLIHRLQEMGYSNIREVPGRGLCGLFRFIFTTGLVIGIDDYGYFGRYCFSSNADAKDSLERWDGVGDPEGEWIKYKGEGGERSNQNISD